VFNSKNKVHLYFYMRIQSASQLSKYYVIFYFLFYVNAFKKLVRKGQLKHDKSTKSYCAQYFFFGDLLCRGFENSGNR